MDEEKKTQKITFQIRERKGSDYRVPPGIFEGIHEDKQKELQKLEQQSIMMAIYRLSDQERFMAIQQNFLLQKRG